MLETSLKLLNKISDAGFDAYIVGGFVRDYLLGIESKDVDICTNARPIDIKSIFKEACLSNEEYGSTTIIYKNIYFELTTFRKEIEYINNRKPIKIEYINNLLDDLKRRDFLINTICMNKDGEIIDLLNGRKDLDDKIMNSNGDCDYKFKQDALRILRAIRIATTTNFELSEEIKHAIIANKDLIKNLSYDRKKQELEKIFLSQNKKKGIELILEFKLEQVLEIDNLKNIKLIDDLIGIWAQLNVINKYPFTKNEKEIINKILEVLSEKEIDDNILYKYGLYICDIAGAIKGIDRKNITQKYSELPIHSKTDINIETADITRILNKTPGAYLKTIKDDIENQILLRKLNNNKNDIERYILEKYN